VIPHLRDGIVEMWECEDEMKNKSYFSREPSNTDGQCPIINRQPSTKYPLSLKLQRVKQTAGNYSSPAAEEIGETKIFNSNKVSGS